MAPPRRLGDPAADAALREQAVGAVERREVVLHQEALAVGGPVVGVDEEAVGGEVPGPEVLDLHARSRWWRRWRSAPARLVPLSFAFLPSSTALRGFLLAPTKLMPVVAVADEGDALPVDARPDLDHRVVAPLDGVERGVNAAVGATVLADDEDLLSLCVTARARQRRNRSDRERKRDRRRESPHPQPHASPFVCPTLGASAAHLRSARDAPAPPKLGALIRSEQAR